MGKPLSIDLRSRVIAAVDQGPSCRAAASRFGVAPSTAARWDNEPRRTGSYAPKRQGGDTHSRRIETHAALIHAALEESPNMTLAELCGHLAPARRS